MQPLRIRSRASRHSLMQWHMWVVLIAGSTGSALRIVRFSNLSITSDRRDFVSGRKCSGFPKALAAGHHSSRHSGYHVPERDSGDLRGSAC